MWLPYNIKHLFFKQYSCDYNLAVWQKPCEPSRSQSARPTVCWTLLQFTQIAQRGVTEGESDGEKMGRMFLNVTWTSNNITQTRQSLVSHQAERQVSILHYQRTLVMLPDRLQRCKLFQVLYADEFAKNLTMHPPAELLMLVHSTTTDTDWRVCSWPWQLFALG